MEYVELVVKIPEEIRPTLIHNIQLSQDLQSLCDSCIQQAIRTGTPLPKGHGKLIDADALEMDKKVCGDRYLSGTSLFVANKVIEQAPAIIEADKESEAEK